MNGSCQWSSWDGGGRWCSWSTSNLKMDQGRLCRTHCQGEKENLIQEVGAFWSQVLDGEQRKSPRPTSWIPWHLCTWRWRNGVHWGHQTQDQSDWFKAFQGKAKEHPLRSTGRVKDHLNHMRDVGVIKPSKSAWSNVIVLIWKKDWGLRFVSTLKAKCLNSKGCLPTPSNSWCYRSLENEANTTWLWTLVRVLTNPHGGVL